MTDVKVEQCDRALAAAIAANGVNHTLVASIIAGKEDQSWLVLKIAEFRQAAEKAQQERDAAKCLEISALIGAGQGSSIDSALRAAATAIRSQGHE